ncbi:MAG: GNAT family N-acetyltransferase [Candidatus Zixiibacteriota bacterium]
MSENSFKIDILSERDIDFAHSLTEIESWGYLKDDFKRLIAWEPEGCFVAKFDSIPVGIITSTSYNHYGFIGSLIVVEAYRNQGIGENLIHYALDYLTAKSVTTIELDGVIPAVPLYRRLGFQDKYLSLRFWRPGLDSQKKTIWEKTNFIDPEKIFDFDYKLTGLNRKRLLATYFESIPDNIYAIEENNSILAYAIIRPRQDGCYGIGPFIGRNMNSAEKVLSMIMDDFAGHKLTIGIPGVNWEMTGLINRTGFLYNQPSLRMYLGPRINYEKNMCSIFSAEKG